MGEVTVRITMGDDFDGTPRLRQAIEAVVDAYERSAADAGADDQGGAADGEVEGFGAPIITDPLKPQAGKYGPRQPLSADGCWGYSVDPGKGGACGWFSYGGDSCVAHTW